MNCLSYLQVRESQQTNPEVVIVENESIFYKLNSKNRNKYKYDIRSNSRSVGKGKTLIIKTEIIRNVKYTNYG